MNVKNIKHKRTGTVHEVEWQSLTFPIVYTPCSKFENWRVEETTDPVTCKNCLKVKRG